MIDQLLAAAKEHEHEEGDLSGFMLVTFHNGNLLVTALCDADDDAVEKMIVDMGDVLGLDGTEVTLN